MDILTELREIADAVRQMGNDALYERLVNIRAEILEIQEKLFKNKNRITELEEALVIKKKLVFTDNAYYEVNAEGNPTGVPYCPRCYDIDKKLCHLNPLGGIGTCPNCRIRYHAFAKK